MIHNMLSNNDKYNHPIVHGMAMLVAPVTMVRCTVGGVRARIARWVDQFPARLSARRSARARGARQTG